MTFLQFQKAFPNNWKGKIVEVKDKNDPHFISFDFGLKLVANLNKEVIMTYFNNQAIANLEE